MVYIYKMVEYANDIQKESAANSILITPPKNKEVLNALDTIRKRLQCEGADMAHIVSFKKTIIREHAK